MDIWMNRCMDGQTDRDMDGCIDDHWFFPLAESDKESTGPKVNKGQAYFSAFLSLHVGSC